MNSQRYDRRIEGRYECTKLNIFTHHYNGPKKGICAIIMVLQKFIQIAIKNRGTLEELGLKWRAWVYECMPGVGLMVRVVFLRSSDPEFKSHSAVELIPGGVSSACHPSEVGKISASMLVSCVGVATRPGLCPIAQETA